MEYFLETKLPPTKTAMGAESAAPPEGYRVISESEQAARHFHARMLKEIPEDLRTALWGKGSTWQLHRCTNNEPVATRTPCEIVPL